MEGLCLQYDGTIRNSNGDLLQFLYGEDGMDGVAVEHMKIPMTLQTEKKFEDGFRWDIGNKKG